MERLKNMFTQHQVIAFFVLTYAITWALWIPFAPLAYSGGRAYRAPSIIVHLSVPFVIHGVFGPALASIILLAVMESKPRQGSRRTPWIVFAVSWVAAALIYRTSRQQLHNLSLYAVAISAVTALPGAFIASCAVSRLPGIRKHLASLVKPRGAVVWYLVAVFLIPGLRFLGVLITRVLGQSIPPPDETGEGLRLVGMVAFSVLYSALHGILGEEIGWRGFALPRLQSRFSPLIASAILGVFWLIWHLPLHIAEFGFDIRKFALPHYIVMYFWGFILTWIYNHSKGSILAVGLMHVSFNVSFGFIPQTRVWNTIVILAAVFVVLADQMWKKLPEGSPGVFNRDTHYSEGFLHL